MKISIITTTYNIEDYIEDTLESVLMQKGEFYIEYIIYDALSTDSTFEKIKKYKKLVDDGFYNGRNQGIDMQIYQEQDNGMYDGIAKGLKKATGDIIAYINGDDYYLPYAFSTVCSVFKNNKNINWLIGKSNLFNQYGQNIGQDFFYCYYPECILNGLNGKSFPFIQQESCFWKRELLASIDYSKFVNFKLAGDFYLWYSFARTEHILWLVDSILSGFRIREEQKSKQIEKYFEEMAYIIEKNKINDSYKIKRNIIPNVVECINNQWVIKKYKIKDIISLLKRKRFRKLILNLMKF